jgi:hypothetical protein
LHGLLINNNQRYKDKEGESGRESNKVKLQCKEINGMLPYTLSSYAIIYTIDALFSN